jgi:dolichol-phosphate mannosyltransferase
MDLSVVILTYNEADNLRQLLPELKRVISDLDVHYEVLVVDGGSLDGTQRVAFEFDMPCRVLLQEAPGYSEALRMGFREAAGRHILTLDADLSHDPAFIKSMWNQRTKAEVVIASRYVPGGKALMPFSRLLLSRILNWFFSIGLELPFKDLSSGFRLYHRECVVRMSFESKNFEVLEEVLIKCVVEGRRVTEVPMIYRPRKSGRSKAKLIQFGYSFLKAFFRMRRLRRSGGSR